MDIVSTLLVQVVGFCAEFFADNKNQDTSD